MEDSNSLLNSIMLSIQIKVIFDEYVVNKTTGDEISAELDRARLYDLLTTFELTADPAEKEEIEAWAKNIYDKIEYYEVEYGNKA